MGDTLTLAECQAIVEGWREDQHPRGFGGKFGSGGGVAKSDSSSGSSAAPAASGAPASKAPAKKTPAKTSTPAKAATSAKAPAKTPTRAPASKTPKAKSAPAKSAPAAPAPSKDKQFLTDHYGEWRGKLSPAQSKALSGYQGADYDLMNGQARGNSKADEADLERAAKANRALKAAINKAPPLDEPMTVYRSVPAGALGGLKSGMVVTDKGFVSTSLTPGKDGKSATVEITLPAGTKAAAGTAREMVLPPGGKFRVAEVTDRDGVPHVRMEYVPPAVRKSRAKPKADVADPESKPAAKPAAKAPAKAAPTAPEVAPEPKAAPETPPAPEAPASPAAKSKTKPLGDLIPEKGAEIDQAAIEQALKDGLEGNYAGHDVKLGKVTAKPNSVKAKFDIFDADGKKVGSTERTWVRVRGDLVARHDSLKLDPDVQGQGLAKAWNGALLDMYKDSGVSRIELTANIDVGGYAWASNGYDFADANSAERMLTRLGNETRKAQTWLDENRAQADSDAYRAQQAAVQAAQALADRAAAAKFGSDGYPTAWEISQLGRQDGQSKADSWIGKAAMLGSRWKGAKWL